MAIRNALLGGTDFADGETLYDYDLDDTNNALVGGGLLGEVKMFALSMTGAITKAALQSKGWAICDGTTPASQGISTPTIATTPDLQEKFLRMSNDETSGTTGGSDTHNHQIWANTGGNAGGAWASNGTTEVDFNSVGVLNPGSGNDYHDAEQSVADNDSYYSKNASTLPAYYEVAYFMKVKII